MSKVQDYNTQIAGEKLQERTAFLWRGEKMPGDGKAEEGAVFSEHSMGVAETFVAGLDGDIYKMIAMVERETKNYRKYAQEALGQALAAIKAKVATFDRPPDLGKDDNGKDLPVPASGKGSRFNVEVTDTFAEMEATVGYMLDILARAPDEDLLAEAQKKGRNGRQKMLADLDARTYADGETVNVGNEWAEGTFYGAPMLWDTKGVMKGILRMAVKCATAMDRGKIADAGECHAVLSGDLPFRVDAQGRTTLSLDLGPQIADYLFIGRSYHRIARAFFTKGQELKALRDEGETAETAKAMAVFQSGVLDSSLKRTEQMKEAQARKKANAPVAIETEKVAAETDAVAELAALEKRLHSEWEIENAKGKGANKQTLQNLARQAAIFHPDYVKRAAQHDEGLLTDAEFRTSELAYGQQVLNNLVPTPSADKAA